VNWNGFTRGQHVCAHKRKLCQKNRGLGLWRAWSARLQWGSGAEPPAGSRGRAPDQEVEGGQTTPWSWKHVCLSEVQIRHKFDHICYHANCSNMLLKRILLHFCHRYHMVQCCPLLNHRGVGSKMKVGALILAQSAGKNFLGPHHLSFGPPL